MFCSKDAYTDITKLLQNGFADEWLEKKLQSEGAVVHQERDRCAPTKASQGHAQGAAKTQARLKELHGKPGALFKMSKFQRVGPKIHLGS